MSSVQSSQSSQRALCHLKVPKMKPQLDRKGTPKEPVRRSCEVWLTLNGFEWNSPYLLRLRSQADASPFTALRPVLPRWRIWETLKTLTIHLFQQILAHIEIYRISTGHIPMYDWYDMIWWVLVDRKLANSHLPITKNNIKPMQTTRFLKTVATKTPSGIICFWKRWNTFRHLSA